MIIPRIIPLLLLKNKGLVKSIKFDSTTYIGDPINAIKIFNDKEVDELVFLDIMASRQNRGPDFEYLEKIATECFMPLGYGGGLTNLSQISKIFEIGFEKVILNQVCLNNPKFLEDVVKEVGSQSVVVSIDIKKNIFGKYFVFDYLKNRITKLNPITYAKELKDSGVGELIINSVDNDGVMKGFDIQLLKSITKDLNIPIVACGGARTIDDLGKAVHEGGASAVAAGSMFVFHGPHRAVLINYPSRESILKEFDKL
jgi:cyclase